MNAIKQQSRVFFYLGYKVSEELDHWYVWKDNIKCGEVVKLVDDKYQACVSYDDISWQSPKCSSKLEALNYIINIHNILKKRKDKEL